MNEVKLPVRRIMILGDSYSTFTGYVPEGYAVWYDGEARENTDVRRVEECWWHILCDDMSLELVRNDSWSGSTVCYTGYDGDCSADSSFLTRLRKYAKEDYFKKNRIDTVLVFGGTNDSWVNAPLGETAEGDASREELFSVRPAICQLARELSSALPYGNVVYIINTELKGEIADAFKAAARKNGASYVELHDVDKCCGHPTVKGMGEIYGQVKAHLCGGRK